MSVPAAARTAAKDERTDQGEDQEDEQQRAQEAEEPEAEAKERVPAVIGHDGRGGRGAALGQALGQARLVRANTQENGDRNQQYADQNAPRRSWVHVSISFRSIVMNPILRTRCEADVKAARKSRGELGLSGVPKARLQEGRAALGTAGRRSRRAATGMRPPGTSSRATVASLSAAVGSSR